MLQTQTTQAPDPIRRPSSAPSEETGFPPPARDLANASFQRGRQLAQAPAQRPEEAIAFAILDELDILVSEATGVRAITRLLKELGTDAKRAASSFADRGDPNRLPLEIVKNVTGRPPADVPGIPEAYRPTLTTAIDDAGAMGEVSRQCIRELCKDGGISLRDLAIQSVTNITMESTGDYYHDYHNQKIKVGRLYEKVLEDITDPKASEILMYVLGEAGRIGKKLVSPIVNLFKAMPGAAKAASLFLFHSLVTQNLPAFVKEKLNINDEILDNRATFISSLVATGAPLGIFVTTRIPGFPAKVSYETIAFLAFAALIGTGAEFFGRALTITYQGEEKYDPGFSLLEFACIPYHIAAYGIARLQNLKGRMRKQKAEKFRTHGL